jgi:hypothetical protein
MFVFVSTPSCCQLTASSWYGICGVNTEIVKRPERPCSSTFLNRLDVIVYPSVGHSTSLVGHFQLSKQFFEARHDRSGGIRVPCSNAQEESSVTDGGDGLEKVGARGSWEKHVLQAPVSGD